MKITKNQIRQIIREETLRAEQETLQEFDIGKLADTGMKIGKGLKRGRDFTRDTEIGRKVSKKGMDYAEKKAAEKGYGDAAALARGLAGTVAGVGGALEVEDTDIVKSKMRLLARQAKYGKEGLKTPTGMPIGDVEIKDEKGEKVYLFMDTDGEDIEVYRDRGDAVYQLVDESTVVQSPLLVESRIMMKVRHRVKRRRNAL